MQVFKLIGDSKIIVSWFNGKVDLRILHLESWKRKIQLLQQWFEYLKMLHDYKEHIVLIDLLSKEALILDVGICTCSKFHNSVILLIFSFNLFNLSHGLPSFTRYLK